MTHQPHYCFPFFTVPKNSPASKVFSLWLGVLVFFFSPDVVHAEFLDRLELLNHLRQGHYQKLEQMLTRQEKLYRANKIPEEHVEAAYFAFANSAADLKEKLDKWVAHDQSNGTALLARGVYFWNIGWKTRGGRYMSKTPEERVQGMKEHFVFAWKDLKETTQKKEHSGIPYKFLIDIAMSLGDDEGVDQYTKYGLQANPQSFAVRWQHLYSLTPWWSSLSTEESLQAVEDFLQEDVIPYIERYPTLKPLLGFPDYVRAEMLDRNDDEENAIPYYEAALKHGRYFYYSYRYGKCLFYLDRDKEALNVLATALQDRPQVADVHDFRARALEALNRPEEALAEQNRAIHLDELDPGNLRRLAWRLTQQHRLEEAQTALTQALIYGKFDSYVLGDLGRLYLSELNNPSRALPYFKKAIQLDGERPRYWLDYGWALSRLNDCQGVEALQNYQIQCKIFGSCTARNLDWAEKTSQRMIWKEGCWREHPTLKILGRLVKWLPRF